MLDQLMHILADPFGFATVLCLTGAAIFGGAGLLTLLFGK
jgi:hypothetical protein